MVVRSIIRLEGLAIFILSVVLYHYFAGNWFMFALLLFIPDISMIGYFKDKRLGALTYNLAHNYIAPILVLFTGAFLANIFIINCGFILLAHVAMDRMLGFGLKYPSSFKDTHIQKI